MQIDTQHYFLTSFNDVKTICKPLLSLNLTHFSYTKSYVDHRRVYLTTHPDLLEDYFSEALYKIGDCEYRPTTYQDQVLLWSSLPDQTLYMQARQHGISNGILIIKPTLTYTEFFNFATHLTNINITNTYLTNYALIEKFIQYFREKSKYLVLTSEKLNFILPHRREANHLSAQSYKADHFLLMDRVKLTKRQYECAVKLVQGYTFKEISQVLNLSPRTVESYINHLKSKFSTRSKTQLVLKLAEIL